MEGGYFNIFPNPTSGAVEVRWYPISGAGILEVYNLSGRQVARQEITLQNGNSQLSLEGQPAGVYFVRLRSAFGSVTRKLIIE